jgi:hypothetical protein
MPPGKAVLTGAQGFNRSRTLPRWVGNLNSLLERRHPNHPAPKPKELSRLRQQVREALGRYFGFRSTPLLTQTKRRRVLEKIRRGELSPDKADVNTRAIYYTGREPRGPRLPDPLLLFLIPELGEVYRKVTGRSPRTIRTIYPDEGGFPFYRWVVGLFETCREKPPTYGSVRDILRQTKPQKSGH